MDLLILGLVGVALLGCSGAISGSETAFFSLTHDQRQRLTAGATPVAFLCRRLLARPAGLLMTLLLANLLVNLLYLSLATEMSLARQAAGEPALAVLITVGAVLFLVLGGEVLPKTVARDHSLMFARCLAIPIYLLERILSPVVLVLAAFTRALTQFLVGRPGKKEEGRQHLSRLIDVSHRKGELGDDQRRFLHEVLEFSRLQVRDVMVPRVQVLGVDLAADPADLVQEVRTRRVSRLVAYQGDLDHVLGQMFCHDVLLSAGEDLHDRVRPVPAVPEVGSATRAFEQLIEAGEELAVVVDEYGGTAGIVTLNDLVSEVVGEMADEHDKPERRIHLLKDGRYRVAGWTTLREWRDVTEVEESDAQSTTLGGLVVRALDQAPRQGDLIETPAFSYEVRKVRRGRVMLIEATSRQGLAEGTPQA